MRNPKIRMIALDMDGTLTLADNTVSERNLRALRAAAEKGVALVACSGRTMTTLPSQVMGMEQFRYGVCTNGAAVEDRLGSSVHRDLISPELALRILADGAKLGAVGEAAVDSVLYVNEADEARERLCMPEAYRDTVQLYRTAVPSVAEKVRESSGVEKLQFFCLDGETWRALCSLVEEKYDVSAFVSCPNDLEIMKKGVDKGTGLKALADHLGIPLEQVMVCGDAGNDLPMFTLGCFNVAMGNAVPEIKALANFITAPNTQDGVAVAIEKFVLGEEL